MEQPDVGQEPVMGGRDLDLDQPPWQPWIDAVGHAVGVDTGGVRVADIHELTRAVAQGLARPMAPVSAYLWGMAIATRPGADPLALREEIVALVRPSSSS